MSNIWMQSRFGKAIDMLEPRAEDVNLWECCLSMANANRYAGAAEPSVSIAFHSMIACDAAAPDVRPWVILHDFHEAYITDITTPCALALESLAREQYGAVNVVKGTIRELKRRHDVAIYAAAGLAMPSPEQRAAIRAADLVALATERRDFMAAPPQPWDEECEAAIPLTHVYREGEFGWRPSVVATRLYRRLEMLLPALENKQAA